MLYTYLNKRPLAFGSYPNGYIKFSEDYPESLFKELTSEEIVTVKIRGVFKGYKIENSKQRRNEALDACKYNLALDEFAMARYFKSVNEDRKLQKKQPVELSYSVFIDYMEEVLFS